MNKYILQSNKMKLRSGREIKEFSLEFHRNSKQHFGMTPFMIFSGIMGMYAGLLAFVFVNSIYYPYSISKLDYFINNGINFITSEFNQILLFFNLLYTKWYFHLGSTISKYLTIIVNHLVIELYGMDSMYCLANATLV
jgi:hypothetical protein